jgi:urocanate hydratase
MPPEHPISQSSILEIFTLLHALKPDWPASLILSNGLNPQGSALATAANIAGAVSLSLEADPELCKLALRTGSCDFVVNTVDEALRVIKNELRKHRPLSVGLEANPALAFGELLNRGVAPHLCVDIASIATENQQPALLHLQKLGSRFINLDEAKPTLRKFLETHPWHLESFTLSTPADLKSFDAAARAILPEHDHLRRRWLLNAPRFFQRERPPRRALWLTREEEASLQKTLIAESARH